MPTEEDRAMDIGNMHKKLVKNGCVVLEICSWTDRQTDRQTQRSQYFAYPTGGEIKQTNIT